MTPSNRVAAWRAAAELARSYLARREALKLLDVWLAAAGDEARPPARRELRPDAMPGLLADIWLMDYEAEARRLLYRLAGENIRARYDFPLAGNYLDEILSPSAREFVLGYFLACVEKPAICVAVGRLYHEWEKPGYGERLLLPLLDQDGRAEGLVGITICKQAFASRPHAEERARRITCIIPLDGSAPSEESS
jgi:hypothetical protein